MQAVRVTMPPEFTDKEREMSPLERTIYEQHQASEGKDLVYELSWEEGGTISVHATEDGAYRQAALHIVKTCSLLDLESVDDEFVNEEDCECLCHLDCECGEDNTRSCGDHDAENPDCNYEDCLTHGGCCTTYFKGRETADLIRDLFNHEEYSQVVSEWNSFWCQLKIANEEEDGEGSFVNNIIQVCERIVLP